MQPRGGFLARRVVHIGVLIATAFVAPSAARAQTVSKPPSSQPAGSRWEISFHGGLQLAGTTPKGTSQTPFPGPTFVMADGTTPTRAVSSWYFGDGTVLLNQVLALRGIGSLRPLERPGWPVTSQSGAEVGVRIARHLKGSMWFEASVDFGLQGLRFDDATRDRVEAARAGFETAFTSLAASAASIISASTVTSTSSFASGGRRLLVSGVVQYRGAERPVRPVVLAGMGLASTIGNPATLTLTGIYRFTTPAQAVIEETDTIRLHYDASSSVVWILGGGMMHDLSRSSAYRVEFRVLASSTKLSAHLDAVPSRVTASPGGVLVLNATNPGLQFSSSSTIQPSLNAVRTGFAAFTGEGSSYQLVMSASYVRRF